jgi:CheY-like chemotaxis protein
MITSADAPATILVVDDDEAKRYIVTSWLRRAGHTVLQAATGGEALAALGIPGPGANSDHPNTPDPADPADPAGPVELVVLDVNLPDITGYDVCRRIKSDPRTAAIPVIQASATAVTVADRAQGLTQGADAYLTEPTEPEEMLAVVLAALRYYRARQRAERTASLLAALTRSTLHIIAAETFDGLARAAAAGAAEIFAAQALLILEMPDGQVRRMSASPRRPEPAQRGGPAGLLDTVASHALGAGEVNAATMVPREDWLRLVPDSTLRGDVCLAAARIKPDRPPVVLTVAREGIGGLEEQQILRQLVQSVALAVEALRAYAEEHLVALTLQRSFLPAALPAVPGLAMSYRYLPASDQVEVGGDFYEALPWGDKVLVVIGDVQGHSLHAAIVMGELRHALRAFAVEGHAPLVITRLVNEVLRRYHPGIIATLCLALLDPASGDLQVVNCGHIPILLVTDTGARYLREGGLLLGLPMHEPRVETAHLPVGGTMLLITDGLVEERSVFIDVNLEKLRMAAQEVNGADVEAFSNHLTALFGPRQDDVAMIAVRRLPAGSGKD